MRILIDTNVLLDVALARPGLSDASQQALEICKADSNMGFIAWHTLSNAYYIARSKNGHEKTMSFLRDIVRVFEVVGVGHSNAIQALDYGMRDLEDAMQMAAAEACMADVILTRNVADFRPSSITVMTPEDFVVARASE